MRFRRNGNQRKLRRRLGAPVFRPARAAPQRSARHDADLCSGVLLSVRQRELRHDIRGPSARCAGLALHVHGDERHQRGFAVKMRFRRNGNQRKLRRRLGAPVFRPARAAPQRSARHDADLCGGVLLSVRQRELRHDIRGPSARCAGLALHVHGDERHQRGFAVKMRFRRNGNQRKLRRRLGAPVFRPARAAPQRSARHDADLCSGVLLSVRQRELRHDIRGPSARCAGLKTGAPSRLHRFDDRRGAGGPIMRVSRSRAMPAGGWRSEADGPDCYSQQRAGVPGRRVA